MKFIVYVAILLVTAAGLALGLDLLTAPPKRLEASARRPATEAIRHIPIKEATAKQNGDPNSELTPVYPAAPGKDLPVKDTPVIAAKPAPKPAETSGSAPVHEADTAAVQAAPNAQAPTALGPAPAAAPHATPVHAAAAPNSCNVQACAATYRSFRASDCSYQPFDGPRKFCDATAGGPVQASTSPPAASPPPTVRAKSRDDQSLQDAIRTVRSLPSRDVEYRDDERGIVEVEPPDGPRYGLQRRWIIERR